jgi:hypothetical protein
LALFFALGVPVAAAETPVFIGFRGGFGSATLSGMFTAPLGLFLAVAVAVAETLVFLVFRRGFGYTIQSNPFGQRMPRS